MSSRNPVTGKIVVFALLCMLLAASPLPVMAQGEAKVADMLAEAFKYYTDLELDKGLAVAQELLGRSDIDGRRRRLARS